MKEIKYNNGGQPYFNTDFELQNTEIFKAIEMQFADSGGVVLSGGMVTGNAISAGLAYLSGKIREITPASGLTFPCYLVAAPVVEYDSRIHTEDNGNKTTKKDYKSEIVTVLPVGVDFITISASGCNKRIQHTTKNDQNGQFAPNGFALNAGVQTYVKVNTPSYQVAVPLTGVVFTGYTKQEDSLNEFNDISGEFTALKTGIYFVSGSARFDFSASDNTGFLIVEKFSAGVWLQDCIFVIGNATSFFQNAFAFVSQVKLLAGEKIRIKAVKNSAPIDMNAKIENLNISRIG